MSVDHLHVADFERFLQDATAPGSAPRNARLVRHLLADCSPCQENLRRAASKAPGGSDYTASFAQAERSLDAFLAKGQDSADRVEDLMAELTGLPLDEQAGRVASDRRYALPSLVTHLIDRSHALRYQDPARMFHMASLARVAAEACSIEVAGSELKRTDLLAQAWRQYANSLRLLGRLHEAEEAMSVAWHHLGAGTRDPLLRARLYTQTASLRLAQRRFDEAIESAEEAGQIYLELEDAHQFASTLVQTGIALLYSGEPEEAVKKLNMAISLIDPENPQLILAACHNLVRCYADLGRPEYALSIFSEMRDLYRSVDDPLIRLRAAWQEALLLRDLGHLRAAEAALIEIRQGFVERGILYETAVASLDLASVYVKLRAEDELKQTVAEAAPIFQALGVGRELIAMLLQLQQLVHQTRPALELLGNVSAKLETLRHPDRHGPVPV